MEIIGFRTEGLGDTSYLLSHEGLGVLIDPQRDVERFLRAACDLNLRWVLETHLHNDYLSGGREAAARTGAEHVLPASAVVMFDHTPAFHGEPLRHGGLAVTPLHTPGHTPEHTSYLVTVDGAPVAVFSGGSLLAGSAGRCDLLGAERATQLAYAQHRSIHRLAALPDEVGLYPTHGAGSFCTSSAAAGRATSTIGRERTSNPALAHADEAAFAAAELVALPDHPRYNAFMAPINLRGPDPMPAVEVPTLTFSELKTALEVATVVDIRPRAAFAAGHLPGSLSVESSAQLGVWVGWVTSFNSPLVLVAEEGQDVSEAVTQLARIGYDDVRGTFPDLDRWATEGLPLTQVELLDAEAFARRAAVATAQVIDVRPPHEEQSRLVAGARAVHVPELVDAAGAGLDRRRTVLLACASGYRAMIAASLLVRQGFRVAVLDGAGLAAVAERLSLTRVGTA